MSRPAPLDRFLLPTRTEWIIARDAGDGAPLPDRGGPDHPLAMLRRGLLGALRAGLLGRLAVDAPSPEGFAMWLEALEAGGWGFTHAGRLTVDVALPPATASCLATNYTVSVQITPDSVSVRARLRCGLPGPGGRACSLVLRDGVELALAAAWRVSW